MTGPEHYRTAELILEKKIQDHDLPADAIASYAAVAQVHATLALAAATALGYDHVPTRDYQIWLAKAGTPDGAT